MKTITKLALLASAAAGAYAIYKASTSRVEVEANEDIFEGDVTVDSEEIEVQPVEKKFDVYKQKATDFAKKASEKATDWAKVVAEKAGEAKSFVEKKVGEYKNKDSENLDDVIEEVSEEVAVAVEETASEAEEFVGDVVEDFKPSDDPIDPEV